MRLVPIPHRQLEDGPHSEIDLLIGGLGYERRSREIPQTYKRAAKRTILLDLESRGEKSYDENRQIARDSGFELPIIAPIQLSGWFVELVAELANDTPMPRLAIDVSSISRDRIARLIEGLQNVDRIREAEDAQTAIVDLLYTPAVPPTETRGPERIEVLGPVTKRFAGFAPDPDSPVVAFLGLGIEQDRAIGALEYIEPATTWVFIPHGESKDFDEKLDGANSLVWQSIDEAQRIRYRVDDPFSLYTILEQLVFSESAAGRPILVPLGPKIFAACCLLVASQHRRAGVWRVTPGSYGKAHDCESAGKLIGLRVELGRAGAFDA
jgi:hypothetical protein